ncbi:MAG: ABC transporter permease subunit [Candidatus Riflebacteria bacterium]
MMNTNSIKYYFVRLLAFLGFYWLFTWVLPDSGNPASAGESMKGLAGFILAVFSVIYIFPLIESGFGSFRIFFASPIFKRRWNKFKSMKRGYYSFIFVITIFVLSFFSEFLINSNALFVKYQGKIRFTLFSFESARTFGMKGYGVPNYRLMKQAYATRNQERKDRLAKGNATDEDQKYQEWGDDWVMLPFYPYGPLESLLDELPCRPPHPPTWAEKAWRQEFFDEKLFEFPAERPADAEIERMFGPEALKLEELKLYHKMALAGMLSLKPDVEKPNTFQHLLGTDDRGRDVFARMVYGFRTSVSFALVVTFLDYLIGITIGALLGFYGGKFDMIMQRFVEIWSAMPFLYTVMIFAAIMIPNFWMLVVILVMFKWMGMTYYIRGEFLREKSKDYVSAARAIGCTDGAIIFRHILPNALTPVISFAPFAVVANIGSLVSLDFLGFGLPAPTPSWGELLGQGLGNLHKEWLIMSPTLAMFLTLLLVSFIGEAIREAFDPKQYSRLR